MYNSFLNFGFVSDLFGQKMLNCLKVSVEGYTEYEKDSLCVVQRLSFLIYCLNYYTVKTTLPTLSLL